MMDLHNSAMYNGKAIQAERDVDKTTPFLLQVEDGFSLSSTSIKKLNVSPGNVNSWTKEYKGKEVVGLKPNVPNGSENMSSAVNSVPSNTAKRTRVSHQSLRTSRCQVEGCNVDLSSAKDYHRRHRICEYHSKSPKVIVAGLERRFCQQCSRFHHLAEFDDKKRSCRRRLSDHNARRRRPQPEAMHLSSMGMTSSSVYDRRPPSFVMNRFASSLSNASWESSSCSLKTTHAGNSLTRVSGDIASAAANFYTNEAPKLPRAPSLLSTTTTSWGINEPESNPLDQIMQGTVSMAQPVMPLESQNWPLIPAQHVWQNKHLQSPLCNEWHCKVEPLPPTFKIFNGGLF